MIDVSYALAGIAQLIGGSTLLLLVAFGAAALLDLHASRTDSGRAGRGVRAHTEGKPLRTHPIFDVEATR